MADLHPVNFPEEVSPNIASYNWTDIANGVGQAKFYMCDGINASGATYLLTSNVFYANTIETSTTTSSGTFTDILNKTYSAAAFTQPRDCEGTAYFHGCVNFNPDVGDDVGAYYLIITLYKNTTSIGTVTTATQTSAAGTSLPTEFIVPITITRTHFAIGDVFKCLVNCYVKKVSGSGAALEFGIGHDPQNRDGTYLTPSSNTNHFTTMEINLPTIIT